MVNLVSLQPWESEVEIHASVKKWLQLVMICRFDTTNLIGMIIVKLNNIDYGKVVLGSAFGGQN